MFLDPVLIFLTGLFGGFVSGFLGVGCGVIITPMLMEFGIPPLIAVSTQLCHAVGTNFTSFLTYKRKMDVDFHLGGYMLFGCALGAIVEWIVLENASNTKAVVNKFIYIYIIVLVVFGFIMLTQSIREWRTKGYKKYTKSVSMRRWMLYLPVHKIFVRSRAEMSVIIPIFIGFLAGLLVSSLGGGNNLFMAPIITYLIGRISPVVYGTTALVGFVITAIISMVYSSSGYCCDMLFVLLLFAGAAFGSWVGVRLTYKVKRYYIYAAAAIVVFLMASRQIAKLLNHSFTQSQVPSVNFDNSWLFNVVGKNYLAYTAVCIVTIAAIAYIYEKTLQKLYEHRKKRLKLDEKLRGEKK